MRLTVDRVLVGVVSLLAPLTALALPEAGDYSIAGVESSLKPGDRVGSLRVGMLCFPKGHLLWRDIAKPSYAAAVMILTQKISALGLPIADLPDPLFSDAAKLTKYRVRVTYQSLTLKLCVPGLGIGEKRPSGEGSIALRWQTFDRVSRSEIGDQTFEIPIELGGRDARNDPSVIGDTLRESARAYVLARRSGGATSP